METEKFIEAEKEEQNMRKAKRDLELAEEESHLRKAVDVMVNNVAAGDKSLQPVVKTLMEFLSK